jgi:uncharacterized protein (TIGR03086 family)
VDDEESLAFAEASHFLVEVVRLIPAPAWSKPGLGQWSVRELVAHANRGQSTVEEYLLRPQPPQGPEYGSDEAVAARGRSAVLALGEDPVAAVVGTAARVTALVATSSPDAVIGSPVATMSLAQYLPSRTAELVIHGLDIARAVGRASIPPPLALAASLAFVAARAAAQPEGAAVLLALTGRGELPGRYTVY